MAYRKFNIYFFNIMTESNDIQGYCWLENERGHFTKNARLESLLPVYLHYKTSPLFQKEGAILKIKGQFFPWPLPKLSLDIISSLALCCVFLRQVNLLLLVPV